VFFAVRSFLSCAGFKVQLQKLFLLTTHYCSSMRFIYSILSTTLVLCGGTVSSNVVNRRESADSVSASGVERLTQQSNLLRPDRKSSMACLDGTCSSIFTPPRPLRGKCKGRRARRGRLWLGDCCGHVMAARKITMTSQWGQALPGS